MQEQKTNNLISYFLLSIFFLLPIFFIPYFFDPMIISKFLLVTIAFFVSIFALLFIVFKKKQFSLKITPVFWPLLLFSVMVLVSSLASQQYPDKQLLGGGGVMLMLSLLVLIIPSIVSGDWSKKFMQFANWSAFLLSLSSIAQFFGFGPSRLLEKISILQIPNTSAFALAGSAVVIVQILSVVLIADIFDKKIWQKSWLNRILMLVISIALGVNIMAITPSGQASFQNLPIGPSLEIAKNSLYITKTAFLGHGPGSFSNAYYLLKPMWLNTSSYWQTAFEAAFNLPLTLLVTLGFVGTTLWLWLLFNTVKSASKSRLDQPFLKNFIIGLVIWQFLMPIGPVFFGLLFIAIAFLMTSQVDSSTSKNLDLSFFNRSKILRNVFLSINILLAGLVAFLLFNMGRSFLASFKMYKANEALVQENTVKSYELLQTAASIAPRLDFLRRNYSLMSLDIAVALSNKAEANATEQEQVVQLINQAIREAKAATVLDPNNYQNWLALAQIYMQLIGVADQAEQEAFNALAKAANLNPNDPSIRISLGQLFVNLNKNAEAITFFNQAIERKPDLAQAHYLLAQVLFVEKSYAESQKSLSKTLSLLKEDSEEYKVVQEDLKTVGKALEESQASASSQMKQSDSSGQMQNSQIGGTTDSSLGGVLNPQDTEAIIRDGALETDSSLLTQ